LHNTHDGGGGDNNSEFVYESIIHSTMNVIGVITVCHW